MTILGTVDIRDFDLGCVLTIGSELIQYPIDGSLRNQYVVDIDRVNSGVSKYQNKVPVFFAEPEDAYQHYILPSIVFKRNDYVSAFDRSAYVGVLARGPSKGATKITLENGTVGYDRYETQVRADPYDISYDMMVYARRRQELNLMISYFMKKMRIPWFVFKVIDSLGDVRHYDAGEMSFSDQSELADVADRMMLWTVSFIVRGEIDTFGEVENYAMTNHIERYYII